MLTLCMIVLSAIAYFLIMIVYIIATLFLGLFKRPEVLNNVEEDVIINDVDKYSILQYEGGAWKKVAVYDSYELARLNMMLLRKDNRNCYYIVKKPKGGRTYGPKTIN